MQSEGRLTDRMLELCQRIGENFDNKNDLKLLRFKLYKLCGTKDKFDMVIWAYKWSCTFSVWKHEAGWFRCHFSLKNIYALCTITDTPSPTTVDSVMGCRLQRHFFGLRLSEMATCGHVMRSLHVKHNVEEANTAPPAITAAIRRKSLLRRKGVCISSDIS